MLRRVACIAVALVAGGCASDSVSYTATAPDAGRLEIEQRFVGRTAYVEGALSYVRIEDQRGGKLIEEQLANVERPTFATRLDPGLYEIVTWRRPCDGSCDKLGDRADECTTDFRVPPRATIRATINVRPGLGCTIAVGS